MKVEQLVNKKPKKSIGGKDDPKSEEEYKKNLESGLDELECKVKDA